LSRAQRIVALIAAASEPECRLSRYWASTSSLSNGRIAGKFGASRSCLDEQDYIHDRYLDELVHEIFKPETRDGMIAIARRMKVRDGIEGLILGGTELPLLLRDGVSADFPFLDTTAIHVERALAACFQ